ncbi:MAG: IS1634 family transposase [Rhodococcus sp. (in: high G+C Gram-positive bacteria)]|nr:MAG: IS1634 family transposase [Rhodococcus sp. (in: high G+C Gram-positive bacteria)]
MHVAKVSKKYTTRSGPRESVSYLLRRTYRDGGKVKHETLANLSALPEPAIEAVRASLAGAPLVAAGAGLEVTRSLPHGHVAAVMAQARALGLPALLGPAGRCRDLALALIVARVIRPGSKLATTRWWTDTTLAADLSVAGAGTDEVYHAMDWLAGQQDDIEKALARRHLTGDANPDRLALFDLSSSWMTGSHCPLAARGYSRDGKKGLPQIEYGLLTDPDGRPVAVRVFEGNTADPAAFTAIVDSVRESFALTEMVMVGDRGMITSARIAALREAGGIGWVTALRAPQIAALAADDGPLQLSLFDQVNLAEITHPDYPGERLIACRNPALADERARNRAALLAATEASLDKIVAAVAAGRLVATAAIAMRVGKVIGRHKMAKHLRCDISDGHFTFRRDQAAIDAEAALDGIYIVRTTVPAEQMDAGTVVRTYKSLAAVERDFRSIKSIDLDLRPVHHRTETRVRAHVLICMLAAYLVWHLRSAWAPLTFTDEDRPEPADPVAPATRSQAAAAKASRHTDQDGRPVRSFRCLLDHLATLTRNDIRYGTDPTGPTVPVLATATPTQRQAFDLLGATIPITLA